MIKINVKLIWFFQGNFYMKSPAHISAKPSHYNKEADHYDLMNEKNSKKINQFIEKTLKKHSAENILDLSCGTGSQVFWLIKKGFNIVGVDINLKMLKIARKKAKNEGLKITFLKGDMRTTKVDNFDAVITIFNSIGHLTAEDFEHALQNIYANLKPGGLYIFDIFNLSYLLKEDNITKLSIDWLKRTGDLMTREIQYSTINHNGILASYDIYHEQRGNEPPKISKAFQTLQVYTRQQLSSLLEKNGFNVIQQCDIDGRAFQDELTERILTVAKRKP